MNDHHERGQMHKRMMPVMALVNFRARFCLIPEGMNSADINDAKLAHTR